MTSVPRALIGPTLADVLSLTTGTRFTLATAFYSAQRLDATTIVADAVEIFVRLDLSSIDDWVGRSIAPDALLRLWERHSAVDIRVYHSSTAHAKVYAGDDAYLIGSANFTNRGLSGTASEILWLERDSRRSRSMAHALRAYRAALTPLPREKLQAYVEGNRARVQLEQRTATRSSEDRLPRNPVRPLRLGTLDHFLKWLASTKGAATSEILARAAGKGQLSGHIRANFFGIRQFLLAHPTESERLRAANADTYQLARDQDMEAALKRFVNSEAADESAFSVDTWRTYLPVRSGGKTKTGGGTSGNLNRMLPQVAKYLARTSR